MREGSDNWVGQEWISPRASGYEPTIAFAIRELDLQF